VNDENVRKALVGAASDFLTTLETISTVAEGDISGLPIITVDSISWENRDFDPRARALWASVFFVPNTPESRTIGNGGYDDMTGFLQIDFNISAGKGIGILMEWERKARIFFHPGRSFSNGGQSALIVATGMGQGRIVQNYYRKSLTISFRSQLKRYEVN
jgi:hypothetical protein